eukprot:2159709-Pyramimonas_sp.AAC.1
MAVAGCRVDADADAAGAPAEAEAAAGAVDELAPPDDLMIFMDVEELASSNLRGPTRCLGCSLGRRLACIWLRRARPGGAAQRAQPPSHGPCRARAGP